MALPPLVSTYDLADFVGDDSIDDSKRAAAVLSMVSAYVRAAAGQTWIDPTTTLLTDVPDVIAAVVLKAAARIWQNPNGATQVTKGPFSEQFAAGPSVGAVLTEDEKAVCASFNQRSHGGLRTICVTRDDFPLDRYVKVDEDGKPIPFLPDGVMPWLDE